MYEVIASLGGCVSSRRLRWRTRRLRRDGLGDGRAAWPGPRLCTPEAGGPVSEEPSGSITMMTSAMRSLPPRVPFSLRWGES